MEAPERLARGPRILRAAAGAVAALLALGAVLAAPAAALAWNHAGHMTVAYIAYRRLTPTARSRVDAIVASHPAYSRLTRGARGDAPDRAAWAFALAATWPDLVRDDPRFYESNEPATAPLAGCPDTKTHRDWHYVNVPVATDGVPGRQAGSPNALEKVREFTADLGRDGSRDPYAAYKLAWLVHLVGDLHQPLHTVNRFTTAHPHGDSGGSAYAIADEAANLHAFWDRLPGDAPTPTALRALAEAIAAENAPEARPVVDPRAWLDEGVVLARTVAYAIGRDRAGETPPTPSSDYRARAAKTARGRIALAGYRLAALLNATFDPANGR